MRKKASISPLAEGELVLSRLANFERPSRARLVEAQDPPEDEEVPAEEAAPAEDAEPAEDAPPGEGMEMDDLEDLGGDIEGAEDVGGAEDAEGEEEDEEAVGGPTEEEMVKQKEEEPGAQWEKYLQPILKDIKNTLQVPIKLLNSYMVPIAGDSNLGFHVTGLVDFLEATPQDLLVILGGRNLRYTAYVSPDGVLSDDINLSPDEGGPEKPSKPGPSDAMVFRRDPNKYWIS